MNWTFQEDTHSLEVKRNVKLCTDSTNKILTFLSGQREDYLETCSLLEQPGKKLQDIHLAMALQPATESRSRPTPLQIKVNNPQHEKAIAGVESHIQAGAEVHHLTKRFQNPTTKGPK